MKESGVATSSPIPRDLRQCMPYSASLLARWGTTPSYLSSCGAKVSRFPEATMLMGVMANRLCTNRTHFCLNRTKTSARKGPRRPQKMDESPN